MGSAVKAGKYYFKTGDTSTYDAEHRYSVKPKEERKIHHASADKMPQYQRMIIFKLAEMFKGRELAKRLKKLQFCDYKTAKDIAKGWTK